MVFTTASFINIMIAVLWVAAGIISCIYQNTITRQHNEASKKNNMLLNIEGQGRLETSYS